MPTFYLAEGNLSTASPPIHESASLPHTEHRLSPPMTPTQPPSLHRRRLESKAESGSSPGRSSTSRSSPSTTASLGIGATSAGAGPGSPGSRAPQTAHLPSPPMMPMQLPSGH